MVKTPLKIFLCIGIVVVYILALIFATMISVKILWIDDPDDFDHAMIAQELVKHLDIKSRYDMSTRMNVYSARLRVLDPEFKF